MAGNKRTYTYKVVADCEIRADVYGIEDDLSRPVIIWVHGGALIMGDRGGIPDEQLDTYLEAGYAVVAIDYRLAPETKLPGIVQDVQDAFRWVREAGPGLFNAAPTKLGVVGHSAGGYLALMSGACVRPRPDAVVSFYGYGDIVGPWYSRPDSYYCRQPSVPADDAYRTVGRRCISGAPGPNDRGRFYLYCRQQGLWPREVAGYDPDTEREAFDPFCPVRNVTRDYPPTLLLHGDRDTDVPYEQSTMMAEALAHAGVAHELVTIPDGEHGFDEVRGPAVAAAFERVRSFLDAHLR